jgi:hypothetical protein
VKGQGLLLAVVSVVVACVVVGGFLVMGSPKEARKEELDRRRVEDLRMLANLMTPEPGRPLRDSLDLNGYSPDLKAQVTDPVTKQPYEYHVVDSTHFELCATFDTEVRAGDLQPYEREWAHAQGRQCFRFDARSPGGPRRVP